MKKSILIEICADSIESAMAAQSGGAGRIELCSALDLGGLTPSEAFIKHTISKVTIPVNILIRPRNGDFIYSEDELLMMMDDIRYAKSAGANGIVIGALNKEGNIDISGMQKLIKASNPLPVTFHRAFDLIVDKKRALEEIIDLGCARLLTSGGFKSATIGSHIISELIKQAGDRIIIMPGAGINEKNFAELVEGTGCYEYHLSASSIVDNQMEHENFHLRDVFPASRKVSDIKKISAVCSMATVLSE